jgi:hypothetical protein
VAATSIVFSNTASYDMVLTFVVGDALKGGMDGQETEVIPTAAQDVRYQGTAQGGWGNVMTVVPSGKSVAIDIGAHTQPALPHTVTLLMKCDAKDFLEAPVAGFHVFHYGAGAQWEIGKGIALPSPALPSP